MKSRKKILIVDDEESLRITFDIFLSEEGYDITTACNYAEAVEALAGGQFDLIFVDVVLGGRSGLDLLEEMRRRNIGCPVVVVTGSPTDESASHAVESGAFDYIAKPLLKDKLLRVAREALRRGPSRP
jgi:two-component system response regulator HydG